MSMTYYDQVFIAPLACRAKSALKSRPDNAKRDQNRAAEEHGIGRSPRFAPGWWLAGTALFYAAVAVICILAF